MNEPETLPLPDPEGSGATDLEETDGTTDVADPTTGRLTSLMELSWKERGTAGVFGLVFLGQLGWIMRMPTFPPSELVVVISVGIALLGLGLIASAAFGKMPVWFRVLTG